MGQEGPDNLRDPRVSLNRTIEGQVNRVDSVKILEIGLYGALIENTDLIRPGSTLTLDVTLAGRQMELRCYVVRSLIHRRERQPDGEEALIYYTQLEFLSSPPMTLGR